MRDIRVYLHSGTTKLQVFVHILAASIFIYRAKHINPASAYYLVWNCFYWGGAALMISASVLHFFTGFASRHFAAILNIMGGMLLTVQSIIKITLTAQPDFLPYVAAGLLIATVGLCEDMIHKIPFMNFSKEMIYGRQSLFNKFGYRWEDISEIKFKRNRIEIYTTNGKETIYSLARQSIGGINIKSAEFLSKKQLQERQTISLF